MFYFKGVSNEVSLVNHCQFKCITRVLQRAFHGCFKGFEKLFQRCFNNASKICQPCFMSGCLMDKIAQNGLKCFNMVQNVST